MRRLPVVAAPDLPGRETWRSLAEKGKSPDLLQSLPHEFPEGAAEPPSGMSRRQAMSLLGAALALGGLASCRRPEEKILPYARPPEEVVPGNPLHFATAVAMYGTALGLLVESHEGRPTKIEGNPRHPETMGATTTFAQAMILDLYDPDRSKGPAERGTARTWDEAAAMLARVGQELRNDRGRSLAVVTDSRRARSRPPCRKAAGSWLGRRGFLASIAEPFSAS
jgi:molybdopterin-containing oxidoreductase family iron-sulfur binding subunit